MKKGLIKTIVKNVKNKYLKQEKNIEEKEDLIVAIVENDEVKYYEQIDGQKREIDRELILPVIENGKIKYLKAREESIHY